MIIIGIIVIIMISVSYILGRIVPLRHSGVRSIGRVDRVDQRVGSLGDPFHPLYIEF